MNRRGKKSKILVLALAALVMGVCATHAVAAQGGKGEAKASPKQLLYKPAVSVAGQEGADFVGVKACAQCHTNEHAAWLKTGHANMLQPIRPELVKADFNDVEVAFEGVEVEDAQKNKTKINPKVRLHREGDDFQVILADADNPQNTQAYTVTEVLGGTWEQQFYIQVGKNVFPSPVRFVIKDGQWRKAAFASFWWVADGTPDGRPWRPEEMPARETTDMQCNGCHTTGFKVVKDDKGTYAFSMADRSITCEACHGPGSKHVAEPNKGNIANPSKLGTLQQEQLCGQCHIRVTNKKNKDLPYPTGFVAGMTDLQDRVEFWTYSTKPGNFFPNEDASKNRQQYHDTMRSDHVRSGVTCIACHGGHSPGMSMNLMRVDRSQACASCHPAQQAMFEGSAHQKKGVTCADCHMAKMGNRAGATQKTPKAPVDVTAHTMLPVLPGKADDYKMRSSCEGCHKDAQRNANGAKMQGLREVVAARVAALAAGKPTAKQAEVLRLLREDGSLGAHNPEKAAKLLGLSK